jgi:GAF domain
VVTALQVLSSASVLLGAFLVTYALLKRRVLDLGFVLNRTIVVAIVSLIVVTAFVLLERVLGGAVEGVNHATGLIANAGLALVLGVSLRYIHRRVDAFVDAVLFRKRHYDEHALRDFSNEVACITETGALLDQAIAKVERHTDAREAALLFATNGAYATVRSFGDSAPRDVDENDAAILALKTWHRPLDPHQYATALRGALALPLLARGRLLGVLWLGERAGGEAYAPDEVEALSQFAHGVGAALDVLSSNGRQPFDVLQSSIADMANAVTSLGEKFDSLAKKIGERFGSDLPSPG